MLLNTPFSLFISYFLSSVIQICAGQELYSFRQTTDALQIYFRVEWLSVSTSGFDGREGIIVCNNISNGTFVELERNELASDIELVRVECDDPLSNVEDCQLRTVNRRRFVSNLTCFDSVSYQVGDIRLLEDGRIVQLAELSSGYHPWLHFCTEDNNNWNMNISNLACQTLGYEIASNYFSIEGKYVSGLENIDCTGALNFQHCTSSIFNSQLQDCFRGVIAIECNGLIATQTMSTTTTQLTTRITTETTTTTTNSSSTNSVIDPTLATFTEQYKIHIIAGSVATAFLLLVCVLGCVIVIAFCIYKSKSHTKSSKEVNKQVNEESKEYEAYLSMKPHPNQGINKSTNSDLYHNEQNDYQHTYLEMQPGQVETSRDVSTVEPLYSDIYSSIAS